MHHGPLIQYAFVAAVSSLLAATGCGGAHVPTSGHSSDATNRSDQKRNAETSEPKTNEPKPSSGGADSSAPPAKAGGANQGAAGAQATDPAPQVSPPAAGSDPGMTAGRESDAGAAVDSGPPSNRSCKYRPIAGSGLALCDLGLRTADEPVHNGGYDLDRTDTAECSGSGECKRDADCSAAQLCQCGSAAPEVPTLPTMNRCVPAKCRSSMHCGGNACGLSVLRCGSVEGYFCRSPGDGCRVDDDCGNGICHFDAARAKWACADVVTCQ